MTVKKLLMVALVVALMLASSSSPVLTAMAAPVAQENSKGDTEPAAGEAAETDNGTADVVGDQEDLELTTAALSATLVQPGRSIVHARGNHFVVDSPPVLGGPNEERNPIDLLLGALATCGLFIYESGAVELGMPLESLDVSVEGDLAVQGLKDGSVNPRVREFRVMIDAQGLSDEEFEVLHERWQARCPVYTTLIRSAPIEVVRVNHEVDSANEVLDVVRFKQVLDGAAGQTAVDQGEEGADMGATADGTVDTAGEQAGNG